MFRVTASWFWDTWSRTGYNISNVWKLIKYISSHLKLFIENLHKKIYLNEQIKPLHPVLHAVHYHKVVIVGLSCDNAFDNTKFIERRYRSPSWWDIRNSPISRTGYHFKCNFFKNGFQIWKPGRHISTQIIPKYPPEGVSTQCAHSLRPWDEMTWERGEMPRK